MEHVRLNNVTKRFGHFEAISNLDLTINQGEFCALLGPSGCGKSTLLRLIAGLEAVSEGQIFIDGREVTNVPPSKRSIAMVFQSYALYPHMSVRDNIAFSLDVAGVPKPERMKRADQIAQMLQLEELMDRRPAQLSGGQRQRVAIGRSLVREPEVFLFDEPLSNLDAKLRVQMRLEIAKLHQQLATTMIYVTHDQVEAMTLADRIVVLDRGRISQVGTPLELYNTPANKFVASFIGSPGMNFLPAKREALTGKKLDLTVGSGGKLSIETASPLPAGHGALEIGIRPEHVTLTDAGDAAANLKGSIQLVEQLGNATIVYVNTDAGQVVMQSPGSLGAKVGSPVGLKFDTGHLHLFADETRVG